MERRYHGGLIHVRAEGEAKSIVGYGAVYYDGTPDTEYELWPGMVERVMPGAFDRAIAEKDDVRGLFNHDECYLLGRTAAGTLTLTSDGKGLLYSITPPDTTQARDLMTLLARGDVSQSSFGFLVDSEDWLENMTIRQITAVRLFDVGPVTFPAYTGTTAGTRSLADCAEARAKYDRLRSRRAQVQARARVVQLGPSSPSLDALRFR